MHDHADRFKIIKESAWCLSHRQSISKYKYGVIVIFPGVNSGVIVIFPGVNSGVIVIFPGVNSCATSKEGHCSRLQRQSDDATERVAVAR